MSGSTVLVTALLKRKQNGMISTSSALTASTELRKLRDPSCHLSSSRLELPLLLNLTALLPRQLLSHP